MATNKLSSRINQHEVKNVEEEKGTYLQKIYPELNIEKWSIWQPSNSRNKAKVRVIEREVRLPDGSRVVAKVEVGFTDKGVLTTEDQKVYYAIIKMWEEDGRPEELYFSIRRLAKTLNRKWGSNIHKSLIQSLLRLRITPFTWLNSYYCSTTKERMKELTAFTILVDLKIAEKESTGHTTTNACRCKFYSLIDQNLRNNHTKPLLFDTIISCESGVAQLLYKHLDVVMADKTHYERRTKELFEDLGLEGEDYSKQSVRKRILEKACHELQDRPLLTGILKAAIKKTHDGKDYKGVFDKIARLSNAFPVKNEEAQKQKEKERSQQPAQALDQTGQAAALVKYFYQLFHPGLKEVRPSQKELDQARTLIREHGFEYARQIVDFSRQAAQQTNYKPQTFGGILQYAPKALASYERKEQERAHQQAQAAAELRQQEEAIAQLETHLQANIPTSQYQCRYEKAKAALLSEMPWLQDLQHSPMFRLEIYQAMERELQRQTI